MTEQADKCLLRQLRMKISGHNRTASEMNITILQIKGTKVNKDFKRPNDLGNNPKEILLVLYYKGSIFRIAFYVQCKKKIFGPNFIKSH